MSEWQPPAWFTPVRVKGVRLGDNVMEIGGACSRVMRTLNFTQEQINAVHDAAWSGNYAHALHVYGRYIKIEDEE